MRVFDNALDLSATDLSNFLSCRHRTALDMAEAVGLRHRPRYDDPLLDLLIQRGLDHERAYVDSLRGKGLHGIAAGPFSLDLHLLLLLLQPRGDPDRPARRK